MEKVRKVVSKDFNVKWNSMTESCFTNSNIHYYFLLFNFRTMYESWIIIYIILYYTLVIYLYTWPLFLRAVVAKINVCKFPLDKMAKFSKS